MVEKLQAERARPGGELVTAGCRFLSPNEAVSVMIETLDWAGRLLLMMQFRERMYQGGLK